MKLDHINIKTDNLEAMTQFLADTAGLVPGDRPNFEFDGAWLYDDEGAAVHLIKVKNAATDIGPVDHFAFRGEDLEATKTQLNDLGYEFAEQKQIDTGLVQLFVPGPHGIKVELQFADPAPAS